MTQRTRYNSHLCLGEATLLSRSPECKRFQLRPRGIAIRKGGNLLQKSKIEVTLYTAFHHPRGNGLK